MCSPPDIGDHRANDIAVVLRDLRIAADLAGVIGTCCHYAIDPDEVIQVIAIRTLEGARFPAEKTHRLCSMIHAVRNAVTDEVRKATRRRSRTGVTDISALMSEEQPSDERLIEEEESGLRKRAIKMARADPITREVLDEESGVSVARRRGVSPSTVTRHVQRVVERIRDEVSGPQMMLFPSVIDEEEAR